MPYQTSPEQVEKYSDLLDKMAVRCLKQGRKLQLEVPGEGNKTPFCWKLRELLVSAQEYPRNQYDAMLRDSVIIKQTTGDPSLVEIKLRPAVMVDLAEETVDVPSWLEVATEYSMRRDEATVSWAVEEDAEKEHSLFLEHLKSKYETIHLVETEEIGDTEVRTYRLFPRPPQTVTREEYYKRKEKTTEEDGDMPVQREGESREEFMERFFAWEDEKFKRQGYLKDED